jgi:hypothetical protein
VANEYRAPVATGPGVPTAEDSQGTTESSRPATFAERARHSAERKTGAQPCKWSQLPPEYRAAVTEAFAVLPRIDNKVIADEMAKDGHDVDHQVVGRHRNGDCVYCRATGA